MHCLVEHEKGFIKSRPDTCNKIVLIINIKILYSSIIHVSKCYVYNKEHLGYVAIEVSKIICELSSNTLLFEPD